MSLPLKFYVIEKTKIITTRKGSRYQQDQILLNANDSDRCIFPNLNYHIIKLNPFIIRLDTLIQIFEIRSLQLFVWVLNIFATLSAD
jgi:hypothetical protein